VRPRGGLWGCLAAGTLRAGQNGLEVTYKAWEGDMSVLLGGVPLGVYGPGVVMFALATITLLWRGW
jgi:hypothetical protein